MSAITTDTPDDQHSRSTTDTADSNDDQHYPSTTDTADSNDDQHYPSTTDTADSNDDKHYPSTTDTTDSGDDVFKDDPHTVVSTAWLAEHLTDPNLIVLDGSYYLPDLGRDTKAEHNTTHIPNARFFDIDHIANDLSDLPHTIPPLDKFVSCVQALGVGSASQIVVYDTAGIYSAPRVWWMFRLMGHSQAAVLDGGMPKWRAEGRALDDRPPVIRRQQMTARFQRHLLRDVTQVSRASTDDEEVIVDARSPLRFRGESTKPREGQTAGHIPRSLNVFYGDLRDGRGRLRPTAQLWRVFEAAGVDLGRPVIATCGSGVTAAVIGLALTRMGKHDWALFDGSWAEWGRIGSPLPIATGDA